ncbi:hypothetical protein FJZ23_00205 [Candidatus Parcubacteria bacterium]|nr:hypothetical protein [Candidatus Parcubacteria bacterium]
MTLELAFFVLGWIFVGIPTVIFLGVSFSMIKGAATDDETVKALVLLSLTSFFMGAIILLVLYLTNLFERF